MLPYWPGAGHIVDPLPGRVHLTSEQPGPARALGHAVGDHGAMLLGVPGEQVPVEAIVELLGAGPGSRCWSRPVLQPVEVLRAFLAAVSVAGFQWLDRRDSWIAGWPSQVVACMLSASTGPPSRQPRSGRMKCGYRSALR